MSQKVEIKWFDKSGEHDYPAAESFLRLIYDARVATKYVQQLKRVPTLEFKAKDIVRASGLSLLDVSNFHVEKDRKKIVGGQTPPHFSRARFGEQQGHSGIIIADGYHRMCSV